MRDNETKVEHVVVPGTFDPVTLGHLDVILRARRLFPRVTVAVAASANKRGYGPVFSLDERAEMIREALAGEGIDDVAVKPFCGLLVDFCREEGAGGVVKGLRAMTDFEYVSSSIVREIASMGSSVAMLVPPNVNERLRERFGSGPQG